MKTCWAIVISVLLPISSFAEACNQADKNERVVPTELIGTFSSEQGMPYITISADGSITPLEGLIGNGESAEIYCIKNLNSGSNFVGAVFKRTDLKSENWDLIEGRRTWVSFSLAETGSPNGKYQIRFYYYLGSSKLLGIPTHSRSESVRVEVIKR